MQMVIYGIGSIESYEPPRLQLCLAILLKRKFDWISDIEVFDPVLSGTESRVLEALGCSVLSINEQGRRTACKPTLFFMPHCEAVLYNNLLEVNWKEDKLTNIALFGNSFEVYEQHVSLVKDAQLANSRKYILAARKFTQEFGIQTVSDEYFRPFLESSWHFFNPSTDEGFPIVGDIDPKIFNARASTFFILIIQLYIKQSLPSDPEEGTRKQLGRKFLPHRTGSPGWSLRAVLPRSHPTTPGCSKPGPTFYQPLFLKRPIYFRHGRWLGTTREIVVSERLENSSSTGLVTHLFLDYALWVDGEEPLSMTIFHFFPE